MILFCTLLFWIPQLVLITFFNTICFAQNFSGEHLRRYSEVAVYYTLNFKYHFFSSLLVFVYYRGSMRLLVALYYIADISSVLPDLNFPFFSSKPLTAYFSWVFFYIPIEDFINYCTTPKYSHLPILFSASSIFEFI